MSTRSASAKTAAGKNDKAKPASGATAAPKTAPKKAAVTKSPARNKAAKPAKPKKVKVVRDSFTMPQADYAMIADFKEVFLKNGMHVKKSEVLRAGLHALQQLSAAQLKKIFAALEPIKTGRPKKN